MNHARTTQRPALAPLEKGQIWMLKNECLEVKHVGKYLAEFSITRKQIPAKLQRHVRITKQLESIPTVMRFLQSHKAVLGRPSKK